MTVIELIGYLTSLADQGKGKATVREKLIESLERSLHHDGTGREMRFTGGDVPVLMSVQGDKDINVPSKWIPVTERLPVKESQAYEREWAEYPMYIVMIDKAFLPNTLYYDWRDSVWFDFKDDGTIYEYDVTHWMPLPEPPKGE